VALESGCHGRDIVATVTERQDGAQRLRHKELVLAQLLRIAQEDVVLAFMRNWPYIERPEFGELGHTIGAIGSIHDNDYNKPGKI
jgi:hypothetical protein